MSTTMTYRSSKILGGYPCAHRKWRHDGHCAWIHGYARTFTFWFEAYHRDENGFVMDFGQLKEVHAWLSERFDHTTLIDADDPLLEDFYALEAKGACKLVVLEDVGMEGTAKFVFDWVDAWVKAKTNERVWLRSVEVRETEKNSAIVSKE